MDDATRIVGKDAKDNGTHRHICPYEACTKVFSRSSRLEQHIRTHTGERPYVCNLDGCTKSYSRAAHLKRHQDAAHGCGEDVDKQVYRCPHEGCEQKFVSKQNLNKHNRRKHEVMPNYKCTEAGCGAVFSKRCRLRVHKSEHLGVLPFQCHHEGCEKKFKQKSHLTVHMKIHGGYDCPKEGCELWFPKFSLMRKHISVDHKKVYTCEVCHKEFRAPSLLKEHQETHQDIRDKLQCPYEGCPRSYCAKRNLTAHIKSYHLGKHFHCEVDHCCRSFATQQKLQQHKKLHDPNRPLPKKPRKVHRRKRKPGSILAQATGLKDPLLAMEVTINGSDEDVSSVTHSATTATIRCSEPEETADHDINAKDLVKTYMYNEENFMELASELCKTNKDPIAALEKRSIETVHSSVVFGSDASTARDHELSPFETSSLGSLETVCIQERCTSILSSSRSKDVESQTSVMCLCMDSEKRNRI